jgi:hypothetical protein
VEPHLHNQRRQGEQKAMNKLRLVTFLLAICFSSLCAFAGNGNDKMKDKQKDKTDATEMSLLGVAAASVVGAGSYLAYRRRVRSRG